MCCDDIEPEVGVGKKKKVGITEEGGPAWGVMIDPSNPFVKVIVIKSGEVKNDL